MIKIKNKEFPNFTNVKILGYNFVIQKSREKPTFFYIFPDGHYSDADWDILFKNKSMFGGSSKKIVVNNMRKLIKKSMGGIK